MCWGKLGRNIRRLNLSDTTSSALPADHLNQRSDVAERIRERLPATSITGDLRHVVRHHHSVIAYFFVYLHGTNHIDVAIVRKCLLKIQEAALDITKVDVENFLAAAEIADHIEDLAAWLVQHFAHR